jgi:two-component system response regulator NreC
MIKVLIADDHAIVRAGLRSLLNAEPSLKLVGEAASGTEAIDLAKKTLPDILVVDLSMPDLDGISVTQNVKAFLPNAHILILTVHEDEALMREAIKAGASGYILKHAAEEELISAINIVLRGDVYIDPTLVKSMLVKDISKENSKTDMGESLTPREIEILKLIVQGYTNRGIGEKLHISVRTVEGHRANITEKLGLHSRVELVRYARNHNLID